MNARFRASVRNILILAVLAVPGWPVADAVAQQSAQDERRQEAGSQEARSQEARSQNAGAQAAHPMSIAADAPDTERRMRLSNKWRLQFSGAAESRGIMVLEVQPKGGTPVRVTVEIERNDGENRVARKVKTAIDRQAGDWVDAELDDGEDVLVKRRLFKPRVTVRLVSSSVKDVRINFDLE